MTRAPKGSGPGPAVGSIVGGRDEQQDAARIETFEVGGGPPGLLLIVADGMGGHAGGCEASRIAVDTFGEVFLDERALPVPDRLAKALDAANCAVGAASRASPELRDMGCTVVAATLVDDCLTWTSVGDSLLLAIDDGRIARLNADHSLAPEIDRAAREGRLSAAEAESHPDRSVLLSALTGAPLKLVDTGMQRLPDETLVLLATDGLLTLSDAQVVGGAAAGKVAATIIEDLLAAIETDMPPDQDNTTLVAVHAHPRPPSAPAHRGRRILGALSLLASLGGALWVALILQEAPTTEAAPDRRAQRPPPAASAQPLPKSARPARAGPGRPPGGARAAARTPPSGAPKKAPRAASETPHFSLSAPGDRSRTAPRQPASGHPPQSAPRQSAPEAERAAQRRSSSVKRR